MKVRFKITEIFFMIDVFNKKSVFSYTETI